jgi:hypothetical protein
MTIEETAAVMVILKVAYPRYYNNLEKSEAKNAIGLWQSLLADYPAELVTNAVKAVIATNKFPPTVAEVIEKINLLTKKEERSEVEAWGLVKKAIRNSTYHSQEEFEALPEDIQKTLGNHNVLKEWAMSKDSSMETVVASNFMRSYKAKLTDTKMINALPNDLKTMIGRIGKPMLEIEGD